MRNGEKRFVRLVWYDDHSQISFARKNVFQLLRRDQIDILLGPYSQPDDVRSGDCGRTQEGAMELWRLLRRHLQPWWRRLVGIASPASDYLRALPHWLAEEHPALRRICVLYSAGGTFGWQVARGILESVLVVAGQSVELVPINSYVENDDSILRTLFDIDPEVVVLAVPFPYELGIMRTRQHWPRTVRVVAAVAAGIGDFSAELAQIADGVLGPSQWEPGVTFPNVTGPASDWFLDSFQKQFGRPPDYIAAGSFATGLVLTECIRQAASLDDEKLRSTASDLDCNTLYGRFRIDSRTGIQTGHRVLLIRWQGGHKVVLPSRSK